MHDKVIFPIEGLDMRKYVIDMKDSASPILYDLYGISNHMGSLNGGHYTAYCKNSMDGEWYEFNDSQVTVVSASELCTSNAYLLFYRRRD